MRRLRSTEPEKRTRRSSARSGSTLSEPQPGRNSGSSDPRPLTPVSSSQCGRDQPTVRATSRPSLTCSNVGTVSMSWCQETVRSVSSTTPGTPAGKAGSSCV
jgi:hypothetical protein